ncbi:glycosyltransferase [Pontibacter sp. Tf4]|uniref:glycosyltransferase family 2 protein n=1 Tax=Pontibacter sp. Tf4 TaxID=2761620 RepID=UPI0016252678|nr:glycosyltransferase family 2 protein [Pontibacter sp. Tf4]MBB6610339.1 glycosyltransferase [Pontibacter sp. Tf4]
MQLPKISIVIPSYNQGQYIEQTIKSIVDQQYPALELIVIDGGSQDSTIEVLQKYDDFITYWVSEPDNGQAHAINKGLAIATGEVFNWINSDDYLEPGALHSIGNYFRENNNINAVIGRIRYFDENGELFITNRFNSYTLPEAITCLEMAQPAMFLKKMCFNKVGTLNENLHFAFDFEWWVRYLLIHHNDRSTLEVDNIFANFRHHEKSKSVSQGYSSQFSIDHKNIFSAIARKYALVKEYRTLDKVFKVSNNNALFPSELPLETIKAVVQDFICNEFFDLYLNKQDHSNALHLFDALDSKYIRPEKWSKAQKILNFYQRSFPAPFYLALKSLKNVF